MGTKKCFLHEGKIYIEEWLIGIIKKNVKGRMKSNKFNVWNMVPACLMRLTWKECNARTFEDTERSVDLLKSLRTMTLFEWSRIWAFMHCTSLLDFINSISFSLLIYLYPFFCSDFTIVNSLYFSYQ